MFKSFSDRLQIVLNKEQEFGEMHGTACLVQPAVICNVLRGNASLPLSGANAAYGKSVESDLMPHSQIKNVSDR